MTWFFFDIFHRKLYRYAAALAVSKNQWNKLHLDRLDVKETQEKKQPNGTIHFSSTTCIYVNKFDV